MATGRYSNLVLPEAISTSIIAADKWEEGKLSPNLTYNISLNRPKKDLILILKSFFSSMAKHKCTPNTGKEAIIIAHYLYDNLSKSLVPLIGQDYQDGELDLEYEVPNESGSTGGLLRKVLRTRTRDKTEAEKGMTGAELKELGLEDNPYDTNSVSYKVEEEEVAETSGGTLFDTADYDDDQLRYAIFMATFCCKVVAKGESNLEKSWKVAKEYFDRFYFGRDLRMNLPAPSTSWLSGLKSQLHTNINLSKTLIRLVVYLEQRLAPETSQAGMIRYLLCLPLSYAGMHAYKLFLAVKHCSGLGTKYLLEKLVHPANNAALDCIVEILLNYESVNNVKKSPSFKYARLVGPQYFQALQTKACPALVYCLVVLLRKYEGGSSNFSPENIFGISSLAPDIKAVMDRGASLIFSTPPPAGTRMYSDVFQTATFEMGNRALPTATQPAPPDNPFLRPSNT